MGCVLGPGFAFRIWTPPRPPRREIYHLVLSFTETHLFFSFSVLVGLLWNPLWPPFGHLDLGFPRPQTGSEPPFSGEEGSGSKKLHVPLSWKREFSVKNSPFFCKGTQRKWGFFDRKLPFPARVRVEGHGGFWTPKPSLIESNWRKRIETGWHWLKLTEIDWHWQNLTKTDSKWLTLIKIDWHCLKRLWLLEIG